VILQLEHDASFRDHSPFSTMTEFLALVMEGLCQGAPPPHHHLVFKAHPLEDGRVPVKQEIRAWPRPWRADRVHFVRGGKLAQLLNHARSAVTVNSTAGQQALWRGLPLRPFGRAVYSKPEFVSTQPPTLFRPADPPRYPRLPRLSPLPAGNQQVAGGFYSSRGRRELLRQVVDMMLRRRIPMMRWFGQRGTAATVARGELTAGKPALSFSPGFPMVAGKT
jgi:capsular polysaccharide export protein